MAVDSKFSVLTRPQEGSIEECMWFVTGVTWHLTFGGELQPRTSELIELARTDLSFAEKVECELHRMELAQVIEPEMSQRVLDFILDRG